MSALPVVEQPPHRVAALLDHLGRRMRVRSETALAPTGLRPRHLVTLTVLRDRGVIGQQDLASALQLDSTNLVGLLNELEEAGLTARRRLPEDRRRHTVELTTAGRAKLAEAEFALAAAESDVLEALTAAEHEALYELLAKATSGCAIRCTEH